MCRFLQGPGADSQTVDEIRRALEEGKECTVELLNQRKDGSPFWNRLSITPIRDRTGQITHFVGVQSDITELKETKRQLEVANHGLEGFRQEITQQLEQARNAQTFLLPRQLPQTNAYQIVSKYVPMAQIGGDFFDVLEPDTGTVGILVADVTGHGIHAALLSFMSAMVFRSIAPGHRSTKNVMHAVNKALYGKLHDENFVAMFYAILDIATHRLTFTQAGMPPALLLRPRAGAVMPLETQSAVIGVLPDVRLEEKTIPLESGDRVLFYSDAIVESASPDGEMLGVDGLRAVLTQYSNLPTEALLDRVYVLGREHSGKGHYEDDFTLVGLELTG